MVFVPRRLAEPDHVVTEEIRAPLALVLAVVAIVGWALAAYFATQVMHLQSDQNNRPGSAAEMIQGCGSTL